jgi:hypothetical protein
MSNWSRVLALIVTCVLFALPSASNAAGLRTATKQQRKVSARERKLAAVRADLHRNLDGQGSGFIHDWKFDTKVFTLTVDRRRYQQYMLFAATMAARSIFDTNGVPLPKTLVIRDISGDVLGEGPFANIPGLVD